MPGLGRVRIRFEMHTWKHGRGRFYAWQAKWGDLIEDPGAIESAQVVVSMDASSGDRIGRLLPVGQSAATFR